MLELTIDNRIIKLNEPEELPTYLEVANALGHEVAQTLIDLKISNPMELINNDILWFELNKKSISEAHHLLVVAGHSTFSGALLAMAGSRTKPEHDLISNFLQVIEAMQLSEVMIDYERTYHSFAAPITEDTIIYLRSVDLNLLAIPIKAFNMIQIIGEDA